MDVLGLTSGGSLALGITAFLQGCKAESTVASDVQVVGLGQ